MAHGRFLHDGVGAVVVAAHVSPGAGPRTWVPMSPGLSLSAIWLISGPRHHQTRYSWEVSARRCRSGFFRTLDWTAAFSIRYGNLFYNPFHMPIDRLSCTARRCCSPCTARTILAVSRLGGDRELEQIVDRGTASRAGGVSSGGGPWASTPPWNPCAPLGLVVRRALPARGWHRHPADRHGRGQLVPVGGQARRRAAVPSLRTARHRPRHASRSALK